MKIRQKYSDELPEIKPEKGPWKSKTIPDQGLTVREIMRRSSRGLPPTGTKVPLYEEDLNNPILGGRPIETLDLVEKDEIMRENAEFIERNITEQKKNQKAKAEADLHSKWLKELEKEKAQNQNPISALEAPPMKNA